MSMSMSMSLGGTTNAGEAVPLGLNEGEDSVRAIVDVAGHLLQVLAHGFAVAVGHYQPGSLAFCPPDCAKDRRRCPALLIGR